MQVHTWLRIYPLSSLASWFLVPSSSCTAMGISGCFSSNVMGMEKDNTQGSKQVTVPQA